MRRHFTAGSLTLVGVLLFCAVYDANSAPVVPDQPLPQRSQKRPTLSPQVKLFAQLLIAAWTAGPERELDHWKPTRQNDQVPIASLGSPVTDISGKWELRRHLEYSAFTVMRSGPDSYDVVFHTSGCLMGWNLPRTGRYTGGVLQLNRPVMEYSRAAYQKLYAVRVGDTEYLVPDLYTRKLLTAASPDGTSGVYDLDMQFYLFVRATPRMERAPGLQPPDGSAR
jgi:hypothetical protein